MVDARFWILIDINLFSLLVTPHTRCRLKMLKLERIKDYLLMEEEFIRNQETLRPQEEKQEVRSFCFYKINIEPE